MELNVYALTSILVGALFFFCILYYVIRGAIEEGTLKALMEYERLKNNKDKIE